MATNEPSANLPLAEVLRAANGLVAASGFPVQFLAAHELTEEAVRKAEYIDYGGLPAKVFRAEYIVAITASVGRAKDKARIEQMLQQSGLGKTQLDKILQRHKLKLPI